MIKKIKISGYRIYKQLILEPNPKLNLIVGGNEVGKSTLMEAIALALTGRINGKGANDELNPYWFNTELVADFVEKRQRGENISLPEIKIELFFDNTPELQNLCGAINSDHPTNACPGVLFHVLPNSEYNEEIEQWLISPTKILPLEFYRIEWRSFADEKLLNRPRQLTTAIIDSKTVRSSTSIDYHLRQIINDHLAPIERAKISLSYRQVKASMAGGVLGDINERISKLNASLHDKTIILDMDQSSRTSWEGVVSPHVNEVPFSMSGQGQQAAIKISLSMGRHAEKTKFVMIEEPENHLSHTSLSTLLSRIEKLSSTSQQLFITTHSTFVLNRLGLDSLILIGNESVSRINGLSPDTVSYFQKLPGYDTLRMVLAKKVVLVEGPSDEIIFERFFKDTYQLRPMEVGIDVISMRGLSLAKCLELCAALDRPVASLRDNDGISPEDLALPVQGWLKKNRRELFIGSVVTGTTLEPQLIHHNGEKLLREVLNIEDRADLLTWMSREKTEGALRISVSKKALTPPKYMSDAIRFIYEQ